MNVTPSQREFAQAHQVRLDKFWPKRHTPRVKWRRGYKYEQPPALTAGEWFEAAWSMLGGSRCLRSVSEVQDAVCEYFDVPFLYMTSTRRSRDHYIPRNVAMYLSHKFTDSSYPAIGRMFKRDHTTIMSCVKAVEKLIALKHPIAKDIEILSAKLQGANHD